jgi:DNA ligase-associated metallophosphoesterase
VNAAPVHIAGERLMLDPAGVLFWPAAATLVVSDLHLEKGAALARRGHLLPPYDTKATLDRLARAMRLYRPRTVVALGDSFHDAMGSQHLHKEDAGRLATLTGQSQFIWVLGNHDPVPHTGLGGGSVADYAAGPLLFRHQAIPDSQGGAQAEIVGHHHPKARVAVRGTSLTRSCFVTDGRRLMMPAFGAYTGGLDVTDAAITALFPRGGRAFLLGEQRLFSFTLASLRAA